MKRVLISQRRDNIVGRGEIRDSLDTRWAKILFDLGLLPIPVCSELASSSNYIKELIPDCILLSGGNDLEESPERDQLETTLLDFALSNDLPVLGVCRGMQMINDYLGGGLVNVNNHVATTHQLEGKWAKLRGYKMVNSYHNQAIKPQTVAHPLEVLAVSSDGIVEAVKHSALPWLGIMWHPERESEVSKVDKKLIKECFRIK